VELVVTRRHLPKAGSRSEEYEDATAVSRAHGRFAVADGASDSSFARLWARLLVGGYTSGRLRSHRLERDLLPLQARWSREVDPKPKAWYAAEKARRGAFAALVGLSMVEDGTWSAMAVGDCCVFQVRDDAVVVSFPLERSADFSLTPLLIGSRRERNAGIPQAKQERSGRWETGDVFYLMSDALAALFLREVSERDQPPSRVLSFPIDNRRRFRRWVMTARADGRLRNDDVSLIQVTVS